MCSIKFSQVNCHIKMEYQTFANRLCLHHQGLTRWHVVILYIHRVCSWLWGINVPVSFIPWRWTPRVSETWDDSSIFSRLILEKNSMHTVPMKASNHIQWSLDLSFPDAFSRIHRSIAMVPERILFKLWR
jgi:hypothetical protein